VKKNKSKQVPARTATWDDVAVPAPRGRKTADERTDDMRFLVKVAFWLGVVVLLIPTGGDSSHRSDLIGTGDAMSAAYGVIDDLRGFCTRQPEACEIAGRIGTTFTDKAQAGAKMLYDFLRERAADHGQTAAHGGTAAANPVDPAAAGAGVQSLAPDEMQTPWRAPETVPARRG
jgi:hypothetical protein